LSNEKRGLSGTSLFSNELDAPTITPKNLLLLSIAYPYRENTQVCLHI